MLACCQQNALITLIAWVFFVQNFMFYSKTCFTAVFLYIHWAVVHTEGLFPMRQISHLPFFFKQFLYSNKVVP